MSDKDFLTIDELARAAGTTVRNVRVYQDRGLLPPPERRGRLGLYGPDHLRRLRLVLRMLGRGYPLAAIRELVEAWEEQRDIGSVLGLEEAITAPYQEEGPRRLSGARFRELLGGDEVAAARAVETGLAQTDGDDVVIPNPRFFDVGLELLAEGFPPRAMVDVAAEIARAMDQVAKMCVSFVDEHLWRGFVDAGMPAADAERVAGVIQRMRPRAQAAADAALAEAMEKHSDEVFTQTAARLASKARRRSQPSA
ncbi:MAG TPA: MerR family transcriptional regulator [Acidimicrobiia bacterium]|nr:MerR family transcriptional regulator [Acidimicrobiia bacterium]HMC79701.1 MerR family transcriptional regulator [Acidimicrobiia bacterium]